MAKSNSRQEKSFLEQLTEFIDVVGKHGIGVALVAMSSLYILFIHPQNTDWQSILGYIAAFPSLVFGCYLEYKKLFSKQ